MPVRALRRGSACHRRDGNPTPQVGVDGGRPASDFHRPPRALPIRLRARAPGSTPLRGIGASHPLPVAHRGRGCGVTRAGAAVPLRGPVFGLRGGGLVPGVGPSGSRLNLLCTGLGAWHRCGGPPLRGLGGADGARPDRSAVRSRGRSVPLWPSFTDRASPTVGPAGARPGPSPRGRVCLAPGRTTGSAKIARPRRGRPVSPNHSSRPAMRLSYHSSKDCLRGLRKPSPSPRGRVCLAPGRTARFAKIARLRRGRPVSPEPTRHSRQ
jgi:hypothetical protein